MTQEGTTEVLSDDIEVIGPGQLLADARQSMKLTQQQVADKLNFRLALVKDIEGDIFDPSIPATFNRGYLKNYAKLVEVSSTDVLASYEMLNLAEKNSAEMQSFSKQTAKQAENNLVMWVSYLILAVLIGSSVFWWLQDAQYIKNNDNKGAATVIAAQPIKVNSTESNINAPSAIKLDELEKLSPGLIAPENDIPKKTILEPSSVNSVILDEDKVATLSETLKTVALANTPLISENIEQSRLNIAEEQKQNEPSAIMTTAEFIFSGDCWVNIYDASGERIAWGIKKSGYVMKINGQAPFDITLGKPELVSITFAGEAIDMSQFSRGNIAKFNLPLSSS